MTTGYIFILLYRWLVLVPELVIAPASRPCTQVQQHVSRLSRAYPCVAAGSCVESKCAVSHVIMQHSTRKLK